MAPRKVTNDVAETPELDHDDLAIFSGDGELRVNQPAKHRWPVLNGGNAFEIVTSLAVTSPVTLRIKLYRYDPMSSSGTLVSTHDIPAGTYTHYHPINIEFRRGQQVSVGVEVIGDVGGSTPAEGLLVIIRSSS